MAFLTRHAAVAAIAGVTAAIPVTLPRPLTRPPSPPAGHALTATPAAAAHRSGCDDQAMVGRTS